MTEAYLASHAMDHDAGMEKSQFEGIGTNTYGRDYRNSLNKRLSFNRPNSPRRRTSGLPYRHDASKLHLSTANLSPSSESTPIHLIRGARLPHRPLLWDINIAGGKIWEITPHDFNSITQAHVPGVVEAAGRLVAPSLCHAHIHLDKCFLLQDPRFADLQVINGEFDEAMQLTSAAKARFSEADLLRRGRQLIEESIATGVTAMRAFVEVDGAVDFKCLDAGLRLKSEFARRCDIQIVAFAQLPLFSGPDSGTKIRQLMTEAASREGVDVLGSTPYVESDEIKQKMNVRWIASLALRTGKPLDLHLDYHLDTSQQPLIWSVLDILKNLHWNARSRDTNTGKPHGVVLGHCTRLSLFNDGQWHDLKQAIGDLPISFVGLPTSDLFMMRTDQRYRGSVHVPDLIKKHGLNAAIAVNNVGNAFTPQGSCDPLGVASLGVGVYSAGTRGDAELLYNCISSTAKSLLGHALAPTLSLSESQPADLVVFPLSWEASKWRSRKTVPELVYDPPSISGRLVIKAGNHVGGPLSVAQRNAAAKAEEDRRTETTEVEGTPKDERISHWLRDNESRDSAYYES